MVTRGGGSAVLQPEDWVEAALEAMATGGLAAVSVERLAKGLGATKGSFYWHFKDRAALIDAALARWEERDTAGVIAAVASIEDPREQLSALLRRVLGDDARTAIDVTLLADVHDPQVKAALERVAHRRLAFVEGIFHRLGVDNAKARALMAFSAFVGFTQLRRTSGSLVPQGRALQRYVRTLTDRLLAA
jgi:AcrR family transcriptional regulator